MIVDSATYFAVILAAGLVGCGSKISSLNKAEVQTAWAEKEGAVAPPAPAEEPAAEVAKPPQNKPLGKDGKWSMHAVGPQAIVSNGPSSPAFPVWATVLLAKPSPGELTFTLGIGGTLAAGEGQ